VTRSRRPLLAAALVVTLLAATTAPGGAQSAKEQREEARRKKVQVTAEVDVLQADTAAVSRAVAELEAGVQAQEAALADARRAAEDAQRALDEARAAEAATVERLGVLRQAMGDLAVKVYMRPPAADALSVIQSGNLDDITRRQVLLDARTDSYATLGDELEAARDDLERQRAAAEEAAGRAERQRDEAAGQLAAVESAHAERARVAAQLDARLDARLAEAASLEALDRELSQKIAAEEAALAAKLAKERAAAAAAAAAKAAAARAASASASAGSSASSGGGGGGSSRASAPSGGGGGGGEVAVRRSTSAGGLATVNGITVSASIADNLAGLLSAAAADGIALSGGGYRDSSGQIATRRNNCGTSDYAIYEMPSSQCSPPTARPGSSMHEQGLAVDFTSGGRVISSRSSPAFQWLAANAGRFGFRNLPSEPWHWSTNGN
jgi:hypothetical protein